MGEVITFYSFKGGVGRTMALANVAVNLSRWAYKVLIVDWDLEAPGLEFFLREFMDLEEVTLRPGVIDILVAAKGDSLKKIRPKTWTTALTNVQLPNNEGTIHFISAGRRNGEYFDRLRKFDFKTFYKERGGFFIEQLRNQWKEVYDYILIDSRTGVTDVGGVCTIQLPDTLVLLFTATEQSLSGIINVCAKANRARKKVPFDRLTLRSIPVASRFETGVEHLISQEWLDRFASELAELYSNWLPVGVSRRDFLTATKIPYVPYFSFGEKLPVLMEGSADPTGLGYAYANLAALIGNDLQQPEKLLSSRDEFIRGAFKPARATRVETPSSTDVHEIPSKWNSYVFISYARQDIEIVNKIYQRLSEAGFRPWMDRRDLLPGQPWRESINEAIRRSSVFLVCVSENTLDKEDFFHVELKIALEFLNRSPIEETSLIPVRLKDVQVPAVLRRYQWVNLFQRDGWSRLLKAVSFGVDRRESERALFFSSTQVEYDAIREHLSDIWEQTTPQGTVYEVGRFAATGSSWEVALVEIGPEGIGAAMKAAGAIQYFDPAIVMSIGIAAGVGDVSLGDVVVASRVCAFEENPVTTTFVTKPNLGFSSYSLEQRARAEARKADWLNRIPRPSKTLPRVAIAPIVAGDKSTRSTNYSLARFIRTNFSEALAVEVEGFGFLEALYADPGKVTLLIRGISDLLDDSQKSSREWQKTAAEHAGAFAFEVLGKLDRLQFRNKMAGESAPGRQPLSD